MTGPVQRADKENQAGMWGRIKGLERGTGWI